MSASSALDRVRRVAQNDREARFTALLHHVDVDHLRAAYGALNPRAATGVDGVTWRAYGQDLEENLRGSCTVGFIAGAIGRGRRVGSTYRRQTGGFAARHRRKQLSPADISWEGQAVPR